MDKTLAAQLVARAKNGDVQAFEELIIGHEKIVYNTAYRILQNEEDAKDVSQEVFLRVYRHLDRFDGKAAFSTWIYRIAYNSCIDETRRRKNKQTLSMDAVVETEEKPLMQQFADAVETPEESLISKEAKEQLLYAIRLLPEDFKTAIILRDLEGFSYAEMADIFEIPLGTVKSRIARARLQLRESVISERELLQNNHRQTQ